MLREAFTLLESRLKHLKRLKDAAHDEEVFTSRLQQLKTECSRLSPVYTSVYILRSNGIVVEVPTEHSLRSHEEFSTALDRFAADPQTITGRAVLRDTLNLFPTLVENTRKNALEAWQKYVDSSMPTYNAGILTLLERVPAFQPVVAQIKECQRTIDVARNVLPTTQVKFNQVSQAILDLKTAWTTLDSEDIPDNVTAFLRAAGTPEGARLSLLTDDVRAWLFKHGVEEAFYVRV